MSRYKGINLVTRQRFWVVLLTGLLVVSLLGLAVAQIHAATVAEKTGRSALPVGDAIQGDLPAGLALSKAQVIGRIGHQTTDMACVTCHSETDAVVVLGDGTELPARVDPAAIAASAHGTLPEAPLNCTSCHAAVEYQFPHEPVDFPDLRSYEIARSDNCLQCHSAPHDTAHPGPESDNPVICTDCHGAHDVQTAEQWRSGEGIETCVACHEVNEVPRSEPERLQAIIRAGLFKPASPNAYCLACHEQENFFVTLANGDELSMTVDRLKLGGSVHGADNDWQPLNCTDCHGAMAVPHVEPITAESIREYNVQNYDRCAECHEVQYDATHDDVHGRLIEEGNLEAAVCTDCHGAHDTPPPNQPRGRISRTCAQCHAEINMVYETSVHGEALAQNSNEDVPTCIDCHGVHNISDPTTNLWRVNSPLICAECHADEELMAKYGISTDVFETYVADFHGTTSILFDPSEEAEGEETFNEAVCYDCHGVHDIRRPDDPESGIKENLVETCRKCHPDANESFSNAWTSHYIPSLEENTGVFLVQLFYRIVIPATVGGLGFLVATDIFRRTRTRWLRRENKEKDE